MKKLHRFYVDILPSTETCSITDKRLLHQLTAVLRYKVGEQLIVFTNGSGDILATIAAISKDSITLTDMDIIPAIASPSRTLIAAVAVIKRDLFEMVVQKLTELGVTEIVPLITDRSVKHSFRIDRLESISREALEQSGGNMLVQIHEPLSLDQCLAQFPFTAIVFDPYATADPIDLPVNQPLVMYIGPEGGWSEQELLIFKTHATQAIKLGYTILRTETAAIVGASALLHCI